MKLIALLPLLGACQIGGQPDPVSTYDGPYNAVLEPMDNELVASRYVWGMLHGVGEPPPVVWVEGPCIEGVVFKDDKSCHTGAYMKAFDTVYVIPNHGTRIAYTSFAHEYVHAYLFHTTGDSDSLHETQAQWDKVSYLNERLASMYY